jgi:hypothetical protein
MTLTGTGLSLNINASLSLVSTNLTVSYTGAVRFRATTTGHTIFTAGKTFRTMNFEGVGGGWTLLDALTLTSTSNCIGLTGGTLNTNGQTVTLASGGLSISGSSTKALNLGSSVIINAGSWQNNSVGGLTISAGTSTISMSGSSGINGLFRGGGFTYYILEFLPPISTGTRYVQGANIFSGALRTYAGSSAGIYPIEIDSDQIAANFQTLATAGNPTIRNRIVSSTKGTIRSINVSGSINLNYTDFGDIYASGIPFSGTSLGNLGNNVNITFPAAKTVYWNLAGAQNWTSTGWATSSGGSPALANFPLAQDTAIFDDSGAAGTITISFDAFAVSTLNTVARTNPVTFTSGVLYLTGDYRLGFGVGATGAPSFYFIGYDNNQSIYSNGLTHQTRFYCQKSGVTGSLSLQDNFSSQQFFQLLSGVFQTNNYNFTLDSFNSNSSSTARTLSLGSSTVIITGTSGVSVGSTATVSSNTATIYMNSASTKSFISSTNLLFYNIIQNGAGALSLSNVTCNSISTSLVPTTVNFTGTNTFNSFNLNGTLGNLITLRSGTAFSRNGIITTSSPTDINTLNFVDIRDLQFNTTASTNLITWYATNSTNSGNNLGIFFSDTSKKLIYLLSGTTITLPNDWNPNNNKIYLIGGGGGGGQGFYNGSSIGAGGGGGGGGFLLVQNFSAAPGAIISYAVGSGGGNGQFGGSTTWNSGAFGTNGGAPGNVTSGGAGGIGGTFNGGNGGTGTGIAGAGNAAGSGGGGGAGGPLGAGANGGNGFFSSSIGGAGGGGGGNGGGSVGQIATFGVGGAGGNNASGVGGGAASSSVSNAGTLGGGSSGYPTAGYLAVTSSTGVDILNSLGSSGGGGAGCQTGQNAGFFGGGGGGGGAYINTPYLGGTGGQGVIILEYTPNTDFLMFMSLR